MLDVNMTLVAQGLNFFIAYYMLRRFLIQPVFAVIQREFAQLQTLTTTIETRTTAIAQKRALLRVHWQTFQQSIHPQLPEQEQTTIPPISKPSIVVQPIAQPQVTALAQEITKTYVAKAHNVIW
jgi:hypothetical protein